MESWGETALSTPDLSPYVCRYGAEWLATDPESRHQSLPGTTVFTDLSGFTALSERLAGLGRVGAEEMAAQLDTIFTALLQEARDRGGALLHFGGDALLLLFTGDQHERRGAATAAAMVRVLRGHSLMRTPAGSVRLGVSTGVWSGDIDLFLVGGLSRQLLMAGAASTGVSRLEAAAGRGEVLLSPRTASALPDSSVDSTGSGPPRLRRSPRSPSWTPGPAPVVDVALLLPAALRRHVQAGGHQPEHRSVTVGFLRWTGMDQLLRSQGGARVAMRLDELVRVTEELTVEWGVTLLATDLSPDGGKIMVAAGAPISHEDDETRALLCMRQLTASDPGGFGLRVGLHRGPAFAAFVGAPFRRTYTCIGDTVNTAARVMMQAAPGQVLATDNVLVRSRTMFAVQSLPEFVAKGKALPLQAYVVGDDLGARIADDTGVMVGREEETLRLLAAVQGAASETVVVEAGAGVGKSRLLQAALERVPGDVTVLRTACAPHAVDDPYAMARPLVLQALAGRRMGDVAPHLAKWASLLTAVTGVEAESTDEVVRLDPSLVTQRLQQVVSDVVDTCLAGRTLLIVVDDCQWADAASLALLAHLLGSGRRPRSAWLARRPDPEAQGEEPDIRLGPLTEEAALRLVRAYSPVPLPPDQCRAIVERAAGNALFLRELSRRATAGFDEETDLPADLESVVGARIDSLAPYDRDLLRVASVIGPVVDVDLVARVAPQATEESAWERLSEFVEASPEGWTFRHAVYRQVAYAGLPFGRRRALHGIVGDLLERRDGHAAPPDLLSLHFSEAREWQKAWTWSLRAADRADQASATVEASKALSKALAALSHLPPDRPSEARVTERLAYTAQRAGRNPEALLAFQRLLVLADDELARVIAATGIAMKLSDLGSTKRALRFVDRLLKAGGTDIGAQLLLVLCSAALRARSGAWQAAERESRHVIEHRDLVDDSNLARAHAVLAGCLFARGDPAGAAVSWDAAACLLDAVGRPLGAAVERSNQAAALFDLGAWGEAYEVWESAAVAMQKAGSDVYAAYAWGGQAEVDLERGQLDSAESRAERVHEVALSAGEVDLAMWAEAALASVLIRRGDVRGGLEQLSHLVGGEVATVRFIDERVVEAHLSLRETALAADRIERSRAMYASCRRWMQGVVEAQRGNRQESARLLSGVVDDPEARPLDRARAASLLARLQPSAAEQAQSAELHSALGIEAPLELPLLPSLPTEVRSS